jgi:hypothetical protein
MLFIWKVMFSNQFCDVSTRAIIAANLSRAGIDQWETDSVIINYALGPDDGLFQ